MIVSPHSQENNVRSAQIGHSAFPKPTLLKCSDTHSNARIMFTVICLVLSSISLAAQVLFYSCNVGEERKQFKEKRKRKIKQWREEKKERTK